SPLGLIAGFAGGLEFNTWNMETRNPFPILDWFFPSLKTYEGGVWPVLGFYTVTFVFFIGIAWLLNKWWSLKE
ncbi:hypothetical protein KKA14_14580, partial [bacterium]|nr:hypothetical protein [bacterium]